MGCDRVLRRGGSDPLAPWSPGSEPLQNSVKQREINEMDCPPKKWPESPLAGDERD